MSVDWVRRHAPREQLADPTPAPQGTGTSGIFRAKLPYSPWFMRVFAAKPLQHPLFRLVRSTFSAVLGAPVSAQTESGEFPGRA